MSRDPISARRGAANMGGAGLGRTADGGMWELGTVVQYNSATHTAIVRTNNGRSLRDVPQVKGTATGYDHLATGTTVVISWVLGIPAIFGCIDMVGPRQTAIPSPNLTGIEGVGDDDPTQQTKGSNNYKPPGAPTDLGPGDWAQVGSFGNHVAVLEGGVASLGSPAAMLRTFALSGTLQTVARRMQSVADFGQWVVENDKGKTSFTLRAGSSQPTQTGSDEQHWTIRLDLGATGDVLDFRIHEPEGRLLFRLHAGSDGRVQLYGAGGVDISSGPDGTGQMRSDVAGDHAIAIAGNAARAIAGDAAETVDGAASSSIAGDAMHAVGGHATTVVGGARDVAVGKDETIAVSGNREAKIGGNDKASIDGDMDLEAKGTSTFEGSQVKLGKDASEPAIKGNQFNSLVMSLIGQAGAVGEQAAAAATVALTPDTITGSPTGATLAAVGALIGAVTAMAALLSAAASGYTGTLSQKVVVE